MVFSATLASEIVQGVIMFRLPSPIFLVDHFDAAVVGPSHGAIGVLFRCIVHRAGFTQNGHKLNESLRRGAL